MSNEINGRSVSRLQHAGVRRSIGALTALAAISVLPAFSGAAHAQDNWFRHNDQQVDKQQKNKNNWRNLAIGAGAIGALGALNHNSTMTVLGAAGALYSYHRYDQERKSQNEDNQYHRDAYYSHDGYRGDMRNDRYDRNDRYVTRNNNYRWSDGYSRHDTRSDVNRYHRGY